MKNIAIIGAGQLGSRHLQAMALHKGELDIFVIDPFEPSLKMSEERFNQVDVYRNKKIHYDTQINALPAELEFVVIATTSVERLSVIKQLFEQRKVHYLLLEKFLFPYIKDYEIALNLVSKHDVRTYVNCTRRVWPIYQDIRSSIMNDGDLKLKVYGSNWNLASNSIHFLDLFSYLTRDMEIEISTDELDERLLSNKRKGYIELSGTLRGDSSKNNSLILTSLNDTGNNSVEILIESGRCLYRLNESEGKISIGKENPIIKDFKVYKQSELTHLIYEKLMQTGNCGLVSLDESVQQHLLLLKAFNKFLGNRSGVIT